MPYLATKRKTIAGHLYQRGDRVDVSTLTLDKLASLVRVGLLVASDSHAEAGLPFAAAAPPPAAEPEPEVVKDRGAVCPICGDGPFTRLDIHARVHSARVAEEGDSHGNGD